MSPPSCLLCDFLTAETMGSFRTCQGALAFVSRHESTADEHLQVRRQLEYTIAEKKGIKLTKPPSTAVAVRDIFRTGGFFGLYNGFRLHFRKRISWFDT